MKKVVIIGYAYSKNEVVWDQENTEYWIMNDSMDQFPKFDRCFDIHLDRYILDRPNKPNFFETLKQLKKPIYMQRVWEEIPYSIKYPLDEIIDKFYIEAMGDVLLMTCTVTYMIALAIYEGFDEISLLGIDEAVDGEYKDEMPGVLYWIGLARGVGIKVNISSHSPLLKGYFMYGYQEEKNCKINEYMEKEQNRIEEIRQNALKNQRYFELEEAKCVGAATLLAHLKKIFNGL